MPSPPLQGFFEILRPFARLIAANNVGNLGHEERLPPPPTWNSPGPELQVLDTRTGIAGTPVGAEDVGIVLGRQVSKDAILEPIDDLFVATQIEAVIRWGVGGVNFQASCDWMHGTQLSIVGSQFRISARYTKITLPWTPPPDIVLPTFEVTAGVGYLQPSRNSNGARLTRYVQIEHPTDPKVVVPIPPFAISWTAIPVGTAAALVEVMPFGSPYATPYDIVSPLSNVGQFNVENAFPLDGTEEFLRVTNTNQTDTPLILKIVFGLAL